MLHWEIHSFEMDSINKQRTHVTSHTKTNIYDSHRDLFLPNNRDMIQPALKHCQAPPPKLSHSLSITSLSHHFWNGCNVNTCRWHLFDVTRCACVFGTNIHATIIIRQLKSIATFDDGMEIERWIRLHVILRARINTGPMRCADNFSHRYRIYAPSTYPPYI